MGVVLGSQLKGLEKVLKLFPSEVSLLFGGEKLYLYTNYFNVRIPNIFGIVLEGVGVKVKDLLTFTSIVSESDEYEVRADEGKLIFVNESRKVALGFRSEPVSIVFDRRLDEGSEVIFDVETMMRLSKYCSVQLVDLYSLVWVQRDGYYAGTGSIVAHIPAWFEDLDSGIGIGFPKVILMSFESLLSFGGNQFKIDREIRAMATEVLIEGLGVVQVDARIVRSDSLFRKEMFDLGEQVVEIVFAPEQIGIMKKVVAKDVVVTFRYRQGVGLFLEFGRDSLFWEERICDIQSNSDFEFRIDGIDFRALIEECSYFKYDGKKLKGLGDDLEVVCGVLS